MVVQSKDFPVVKLRKSRQKNLKRVQLFTIGTTKGNFRVVRELKHIPFTSKERENQNQKYGTDLKRLVLNLSLIVSHKYNMIDPFIQRTTQYIA